MTNEFIHEYKGYGVHQSQCLVKMYRDDGEILICFVNMGVGTSVTNASEQLAKEITNEYDLHPENCRYFESYKEYSTFDEIKYDWKLDEGLWVASKPQWSIVGEDDLRELFTND